MTLAKICGLSEPEHASAAASFGADFVGVVFAPGRRRVTVGQAREIGSAIGRRGPPPRGHDIASILAALERGKPLLVGVFADQDVDTVNAVADQCGLDVVQLSGSEPWQICNEIDRPVFKCRKVHEGEMAVEILSEVDQHAVLLLDPYVEGAYGGTGRSLDWTVAAEIAERLPVVLAGGLTPDNVAEAVTMVRPWVADVSSGVETDGTKDPDKIRAFLRQVKEVEPPERRTE